MDGQEEHEPWNETLIGIKKGDISDFVQPRAFYENVLLHRGMFWNVDVLLHRGMSRNVKEKQHDGDLFKLSDKDFAQISLHHSDFSWLHRHTHQV